MRLTAIYIKHHYLFSSSQIINLGGKYFYEIIERGNKNEYDLKKIENSSFIDNFWGENISLISAIVGENGSGKTSLLKEIDTYNNYFPNTFFIWENSDDLFFTQIYYSSYYKENPKIFFNGKELLNKSEILEFTQSIYYSPVLSYEYNGYRDISYRTRFYNTSRATVYLTLNTLLEKNDLDLNNFISQNLKHELIFCEKFKNSLKDYTFLDYNVFFSTIREKLYNHLSDWFSYKNMEDKDDDDYLRFKNLDSTLREEEKIYYEEFKNIESKLNFDYFSANYNYSLPYDFYIEFILFLKYYFKERITYILKTESLDGNLDKVVEKFFKTIRPFRNKNTGERFENIKKLYYLIVEKISNNDSGYTFSRKDAIDIINLQEKIAFSVEPKVDLISGAQFFTPNPTNVLSSGEKSLLNLFSNIYSTFSDSYLKYADEIMDSNNKLIDYNQKIERIILFLDEADLGFHPQWKKKYIKIITDIFPKMFKEINGFKSLQIIFTTHESLTLSDIPNGNIIYLKKENEETKVLSEFEKPKKSFGANITDLLADSFSVEDGLIGDFAKNKISITLEWLKRKANEKARKNEQKNLFETIENITIPEFEGKNEEIEYHTKIINLIDEPIVKQKLKEMFIKFVSEDNIFKNEQIKELEEKLKKLREE